MKHNHVILFVLIGGLCLSQIIQAQYQISGSVFGNGGTPISNTSYQLVSTLGQPLIGISEDALNINQIGYWYNTSKIISSVVQIPCIQLIEFQLNQNYPNPFNPETTIGYQLPEPSLVTIKIFNTLGREIVTLVDENKPAGFHTISWNACDSKGSLAASGIYLYQIRAKQFTQNRKMLLLR